MANSITIIDQLYKDGNELVNYLKSQQQLSFYNEAENSFRKTILLSAASYFEKEITDTIVEFAKFHTNDNVLVISIIKQKAISRQYHTYFDWDQASNANKFFSLFGEEFKNMMIKKVKDEDRLNQSIKAFLEIGQERNKMVHQNFAEIVIDKTAEEIYKLYQDSLFFVRTIKQELIQENVPKLLQV